MTIKTMTTNTMTIKTIKTMTTTDTMTIKIKTMTNDHDDHKETTTGMETMLFEWAEFLVSSQMDHRW